MLTQIRLLRLFIQADKNTSLQAHLVKSSNASEERQKAYDEIVRISDKIKYKTSLSLKEILHAARYYRSLTNEIKGKTLRYGAETNNKRNLNDQ